MKRGVCDICDGIGMIRLPVRSMGQYAASAGGKDIKPQNRSREYPCPECSDYVPQDRLAVVMSYSKILLEHDSEEFRIHPHQCAARAMADELLSEGYITFSDGSADDQGDVVERAILGVVSPRQVATLEQRVAERQEVVARAVVDEAKKRIRNWGSDYTGDEGHIRKGQAAAALDEALTACLAKPAA